MSGFDADWLSLREPADRAARDRQLAQSFIKALPAPPSVKRLIDLGGGTGANLRVLAPLMTGDQHWLLVDWDAALLGHACSTIANWARAQGWQTQGDSSSLDIRTPQARWLVQTRQLDLARSLESLDPRAFDGVVTTAFLDLVSAAWLDRLALWLQQSRCPLLATLTVDGRRQWLPAHEHDLLIHQAFRSHQGGDKGFGESLGPGASDHLRHSLAGRGFRVHMTASDWQLDSRSPQLLATLVRDEAAVAEQVRPDSANAIADWRKTREFQSRASKLTLVVGHQDLLALPG